MTGETLHVLLIGHYTNAPDSLPQVVNGTRLVWQQSAGLAEGLARLAAGSFQAAILDGGLLAVGGLDTFGMVQAEAPQVPVVALVESEAECLAWSQAGHPLPPCLLRERMNGPGLLYALRAAIETHRLRHALNACEANFRNIIDNNADGIVVIDAAGVIRFVNPAAETLFDRSAAALVGALFGFPIVAGETAELDIIRANGQTVVVEMRVVDAEWEGKPAALASLRDVTKRRQAEEALRRERDFAQGLLETAQAIVLLLDSDGRIVQFNPFMEELSGYTLAEVQGQDWFSTFLPPRDHEEIRDLFSRAVSGVPTRGNVNAILTKDGRERMIEWHSKTLTDSEGHTVGVLAIGLNITERQQAEQELRASEARFRAIFANAAIGSALLDRDGRLLMSNPALQDMLGYSAHDLQGMAFADLIHEEDVPHDQHMFGEMFDGRHEQLQLEQRYLRRDGHVVWGRMTASLVHGLDGQPRYSVQMVEDITQRKLAEAAEHRQRLMTEALRNVTAALLSSTLDLDEIFHRLLADVARVVPYEAAMIMLVEDGVARTVRSATRDRATPGEQLQDVRFVVRDVPLWHKMALTREPVIVADVAHESGWPVDWWSDVARAFVGVPICLEDQVIGFLNLTSAKVGSYTPAHAGQLQAFADQAAVAIRNAQLFQAVQRYAAELEQRVEERTAELEQERAQLQAILDAMGEGVLHVDTEERVRYTNRAFLRLTGYSPEELRQHPFSILRAASASDQAAAAWEENVARTIARGQTWRGEIRLRRKDGTPFDAGVTITAVTGPDNRRIGRVELLRDISQQKALQDQKDRFIANASHELRTPLTNIRMRMYLIRRQPDALDRHLPILEQVVQHMESLVDDLLEISRFERGVIGLRAEKIVLQDVVNSIIAIQRPHAEQKDISLVIDLPATPLCVWGDAQRLTQVLTNLITNAINYTEPGGSITISLVAEGGPDHRRAVLRVRDNGVGIEAESLEHIFEPFYRAADNTIKGTGLGLTISKEIVELHGGELTVESKPGTGSVFTITLDLLNET